MFKFIGGMLFAVILMQPDLAKNIVSGLVDIVHNTSVTAAENIEGKATELAAKE